MESGEKTILSIILIVSAGLVLYPQINTYSQIPDSDLTSGSKNQMLEQIIGFSLLFLVALCLIWTMPDKNEILSEARLEMVESRNLDSRALSKELSIASNYNDHRVLTSTMLIAGELC